MWYAQYFNASHSIWKQKVVMVINMPALNSNQISALGDKEKKTSSNSLGFELDTDRKKSECDDNWAILDFWARVKFYEYILMATSEFFVAFFFFLIFNQQDSRSSQLMLSRYILW